MASTRIEQILEAAIRRNFQAAMCLDEIDTLQELINKASDTYEAFCENQRWSWAIDNTEEEDAELSNAYKTATADWILFKGRMQDRIVEQEMLWASLQ